MKGVEGQTQVPRPLVVSMIMGATLCDLDRIPRSAKAVEAALTETMCVHVRGCFPAQQGQQDPLPYTRGIEERVTKKKCGRLQVVGMDVGNVR